MEKEVKPITPDEVVDKKIERLPPFVIEAWNTEIAKQWDGKEARIYQEVMIDKLVEASGITKNNRLKVLAEKWLDVEEIYRRNGWSVTYDKPAYNESYPPFFVFKRK